MNKLLEEAFAQAAKLPEHEQETVAAWLLEELRHRTALGAILY